VINDDAGRSIGEDQTGVPGAGRGSTEAVQLGERSGGVSERSGIVLLSEDAKHKLEERGAPVVDLQDQSTDTAAFSAALDAARTADEKNGWAVTPKTVEELSQPGNVVLMTSGGTAGLVVTPDGDIEAVFSNKSAGAPKGVTKTTIPTAIANGGTKLDCYGAALARLYTNYGFIPVARVAFNPEYANPGWDQSKGTPDIYIMMHCGDDADTVVDKLGTYDMPTDEQLAALPLMEYDDAMAYRDWKLERRNTQNAQAAAEPQNAPVANPAPQGAEIPPTWQESNTGGLTAPETNAEARTAQGEAKTAPGTGKEKVSQFFSNTLTNREGESVGDPLTYLTKSEAETLQNAVNRLNMNGEAEMGTMLATTMWNDEQVKMAKVIGSALFNDSEVSGDKAAYNAWRKIEREHATAIARALRAYGSDPEMEVNAESIARMADRYLSLVEDGAVPEVGKLSKEQIQEARTRSEEATSELAKLEAAEKQHVDSGLSGDEAFEKVKDGYLDLAQKLVAQRNVGLLWDNILGRNKALRNGVEGVMTRLRKILAKQDADYIRRYVQSNVAAQTGDLKYQAGLTADGVGKWINSFQKLCQLFGTGTTLRNTEGNVLFGTLDFLSNDIAGAAADSFLSLFTGNRTRGIETGVFGGKNRSASRTAVEHSILEIAANMDMSEDGKYIGSGQSAFNPYKIGGRFLQRTNQVLSYALNATDAAAVGMAKQSAADAAQRANRHSGGNMTEETAARIGEQEAAYRAFKNETTPQKVLEFFRDALDLIGVGGEKTKLGGVTVGRKGGFGAGTLIAPYIGVPVNIAMKGVEYSPIGAAIGVKNAAAAAKMAKGANPNSEVMQDSMVLQNKAAGQIGRGVLGTALTVLLASLMKQAKEEDKEWFKNWDMETDPDVRAQNKAEGKSGQQINKSMLMSLLFDDETNGAWLNGDDLVNISSIEPLNQYLGLASLLADDDDALDVKGYLKALAAATGDSMEDLPSVSWLGQISDTINYNPVYETKVTMDEEGNLREERVEDKWATGVNAGVAMLGNALSGFIPAPVRHASAASDEYQRDTKGENAAETAWNQIINSTPWRQNLPVKTDNYGNPISQGDLATRLANQYLANKYTEVNQSEVSREVERLREATGVDLTPDRTGPKSQSFGKGKDKQTVSLDAEDSRAWKNAYGKAFEELMTEMMGSETYRGGSADSQTELGGVMKNFAKDSIKKDFAEYYGLPYESQYDEIRKLDRPEQYLAAHELWGNAMKEGDWDTVDMLLQSSMSDKDREYMREHTGKFGTYYDFAQDGVSARKADQYQTELEDLYTSEDRSSANGYDILRTVASGDYTDEEADAIMNRTKSDGSYYAGKGRVAVYNAVRAEGYGRDVALQFWDMLDTNQNGRLTKKELKAAIGAFPEPYRSNIRRSVSSAMGW
jgi:hypothetical protein